jgi:hypothetical protein
VQGISVKGVAKREENRKKPERGRRRKKERKGKRGGVRPAKQKEREEHARCRNGILGFLFVFSHGPCATLLAT